MLLNRIEKALEEYEDHSQTDFGRSHGTEDNVSSILLRTLLVTVDREVHSRSLQVDPVFGKELLLVQAHFFNSLYHLIQRIHLKRSYKELTIQRMETLISSTIPLSHACI